VLVSQQRRLNLALNDIVHMSVIYIHICTLIMYMSLAIELSMQFVGNIKNVIQKICLFFLFGVVHSSHV
jgi:hypothetical protein